MSKVSFADIVSEELNFNSSTQSGQLILELIDTSWVQRLRDISQTGNTRLVYMFSEHSRFGHSVGVAYLTSKLLNRLSNDFADQVDEYRLAISAAALLHDIAHIAPGSHTALKVWFPDQKDQHEETAAKVIEETEEIKQILESYEPGLCKKVIGILTEDSTLPPWTWQILSGGGWNVDRGNWCVADSVMAGVSYGKYNIAALTDSISISKDQQLALKENRLDAMLHFAVSRHAMYKQVYQHRVLLAADKLTAMIAKRLRALKQDQFFADPTMQKVLQSSSIDQLSFDEIFQMRESWWKYHLLHWTKSTDKILADLSSRLLNRRLFKTVSISQISRQEELLKQASAAVTKAGYDPEYYLDIISSVDRFAEDSQQTIKVIKDDGSLHSLQEMDTLFQNILQNSKEVKKYWLCMPEEAKRVFIAN